MVVAVVVRSRQGDERVGANGKREGSSSAAGGMRGALYMKGR